MTELSTADLWDQHEEQLAVVQPALRSFGGRVRFRGRIATVKCFEDNSKVKEAVNEPGQGRVLVVDGGGSLRCALLGDQVAGAALKNGWTGVVIYGCIRDAVEVSAMDLGVVALGTSPRKSTRRGEGVRDLEVHFHDVTFRPGDTLVADEDGIVVGAIDESV